jgi:BlaI family penicillinase repressor
MKELTKAEENIMQILWKLEKAFVHDVIKELPSPKPSYTTVSTIIRLLEKKGFVGYKAYGKTHEYFPEISKEEYTKATADKLMKNYFENSFEKMISFFVNEKKLKVKDLDEIFKLIEKQEKRK